MPRASCGKQEARNRARGHCILVMVALYDRHVQGGLVWIDNPPPGIVGASVGPAHAAIGQMALLPHDRTADRLLDRDLGVIAS